MVTRGGINNIVNAVYYELCSGDSDLKSDSYRDGYVSRWDRLNYTKDQTEQQHYTEDVWLYYSEYSAHMYVWRRRHQMVCQSVYSVYGNEGMVVL